MKTARSTRLLLSLLLILLALAPRSTQTQAAGSLTTCTATDLGTLPGGMASIAMAINASGQVAGAANMTDAAGKVVVHAVRWDAGATSPTDLGTLPSSTSSFAYGINASGEVVGHSGDTAVEWAPVVTATTPITPLGLLPSGTTSSARAINANGQVVGYADTKDPSGNLVTHAVRWDAGATSPTDLSTKNSVAMGINTSGAVVGGAEGSGAAEWPPGATATTPITALGLLQGSTAGLARAINDGGQVVGDAVIKDANGNTGTHAVLWNGTTTPTDLGTLSGITATIALGINASGVVVGAAGTTPDGDTFGHAVLWNAGATTPTDLDSLLPSGSGWALESANAINDAGQIVGAGSFNNGPEHAVRLTCS